MDTSFNCEKEQWRVIPGHPKYAISDKGRIKVLVKGRRYKRGDILPGAKATHGYWQVTLNGKQWRVHRLVMLAFVGPCPERMEVNHINGIKDDNRLCNLEYVTRKQNMKHAYSQGLKKRPKGEANYRAKLTESDIREIRNLKGKLTQREIAEEYGVSRTAIGYILRSEHWSHID